MANTPNTKVLQPLWDGETYKMIVNSLGEIIGRGLAKVTEHTPGQYWNITSCFGDGGFVDMVEFHLTGGHVLKGMIELLDERMLAHTIKEAEEWFDALASIPDPQDDWE